MYNLFYQSMHIRATKFTFIRCSKGNTIDLTSTIRYVKNNQDMYRVVKYTRLL